MSIWGKILGGAAGFALGGPLGAILGAVAGHAVDRMRDGLADAVQPQGAEGDLPPHVDTATKRIAFTIGVIVLGAKMAKADGQVTRDEVAAFKEVFHIPPHEAANVGRLFDRARRDAEGFEPYASQLARLFRHNPAVLEELIDGLFHIARADGAVNEDELKYLESVAVIFGLSPATWQRLRAANVTAPDSNPYAILGVAPSASQAEIKAAYRTLVKENHPDRLMAQGLPQEFVDIANEKLARINAAYDLLDSRARATAK
ncbi:MAG: TerB family tellurite resistance protein [Kiloniellales bacterium]